MLLEKNYTLRAYVISWMSGIDQFLSELFYLLFFHENPVVFIIDSFLWSLGVGKRIWDLAEGTQS